MGRPKRGPVAERLWAKIDRSDPNGCWPWTAGTNAVGYGKIADGVGRLVGAHRLAYELVKGPIREEGVVIDHLCRNTLCCNPDHLEAVTYRENYIRGNGPEITKARHRARTHCKNGHEFTEENTFTQTHNGSRGCRACRKDHGRRYQDKLRDKASSC